MRGYRLPQLAVLAKILCLLMVLMCGAVPSTVPSVSLYSTCSRGYVTVYGRTVKSTGRNDHNAPYQKLTTQSTDFSRKLYIFAEKSKRYICFNKRWKIITLPEKRRNEYCQFNETYNGRYLRYHSVVDPTRYIGFSRAGRPIAWPRGRQECYNFLKLNPNAGVERHNSLITSAKGGGLKHPPQPPQRPDRDRGTSSAQGPFGGPYGLGAPALGSQRGSNNALRTMSNALGKINLNLVNTGPGGGGGGGGGSSSSSSKNALVSSSSLGSKSLTLSSLSSSFSSSSSSPPSSSSTSLMLSSSASSGRGNDGKINLNNHNNNRKLRQQQQQQQQQHQQQKQLTTSPGQRRPHRHRHGKSWDQAGTSRRRHHRLQQQQQPSSSSSSSSSASLSSSSTTH